MSGFESAKAGDLTFAMDEEKLGIAEKSGASCILTSKSARKSAKPLIRVEDPKLAFLIIYNTLNKQESRPAFTHPSAVIAPSVKAGKNVWIGAHVVVEDGVTIGDNTIIEHNTVIKKNCRIGSLCRIYPNVTLYENTVLGNSVVLHGGVVLGADGFGYVKAVGRIFKFPQLGKVVVEDNVEIGANTCVDKGSLKDTIIGAGSKIDNLCQIAHNIKIGKNVIMAAQNGIAGSCVIKDNVMLGGQVGISDNITIGENAMVGGQSGVINDIEPNTVYWGYPARPIARTKRQLAVLSWMTKNFKELSKIIKKK
jgi:UDP-3-O-[3-hydroxymyristoyl] glucosamine N-acyltransferase